MSLRPDADVEAELQRLRLDIDERDDLVALATHELRNQLHTLTLQLKLAQLAAAANDAVATAEHIAKAQTTLARYIERVTLLLDLTRLSSNAYPLTPREIDLVQALRQIIDGVLPEAQFRGVAVTTSLPATCPAFTDASVLEHVVGNLLLNAFKHAVCTSVHVSLSVPDGDGAARIAVADDGIGIAPEQQRRMFAKFARGERSAGSGLGLWIVRKLIEVLGGTIELDSRPGAGSTFTLVLPRVPRGSTSP